MSAVKPGNTLGDIGWSIQTYAEARGCSVVREFVGHGVGFLVDGAKDQRGNSYSAMVETLVMTGVSNSFTLKNNSQMVI